MDTSGPGGTPVGRRVVLGMLALGAAGVLVGPELEKGAGELLRPLQGSGLTGVIPGGGGFIEYTVTSGFPAPPKDYRLQVDGMVRRPLSFSLEELEALPPVALDRTFQCVTGWSVPDVHWVGVRLTDLATRAVPTGRVFHFSSFDGVYTESLTWEQAEQTGAIVAYRMLGAPLTRGHGGPVRLYVPDMFGYKSIKWLSRVTLSDRVEPGYWEQNGYPEDAWISGHPPKRAG
ncbi:MAG: molybdopterin-dependent oxidoreductase [Actinomycetota bacterium]|nr:molybdopterin-dependent oxidoreductase [Actinomycetota bacterium]